MFPAGNVALTELNLAEADFSSLTFIDLGEAQSNEGITSVSLENTLVNQTSLAALFDGGALWLTGIGDKGAFCATITELDLSGIDFDTFSTAGGGLLAAWDAEPGHHVEFLQIGDVNHDTEVTSPQRTRHGGS